MRNTQCRTWNMERNSEKRKKNEKYTLLVLNYGENLKNETQTLYDMEYGKTH